MKKIIFTLSLILGLQNVALAEQQFIQCEATPTEYANNEIPAAKSALIPIKIVMQQPTMVMGQVEPSTFKVHSNYEVRISGSVMKPGGSWVKGETKMLLSAELLQIIPGKSKKRLLGKDVASSDSVSSEAQLAALKAGTLTTAHYLYNSDYLLAIEEGTTIAKDMLVSVSVKCQIAD